MTDPIMEEVYRARELLWERGGGTMRGLVEYLQKREAERLAGEGRGAEPEPDEAWKMAVAVGEKRARYGAARSEKRKEKSEQRAGKRFYDPTMQRSNEPTSDEVTR